MREARVGHGVLFFFAHKGRGVYPLCGEPVLGKRRLKGFVVFGERPVEQAGAVKRPKAVHLHDEGVPAAGCAGAVHHVTHPGPVLPGHHGLFRVPGVAVFVHRSPVVEYAPVGRPRETPVGAYADTFLLRRAVGVAPGHHVAFFRPGTAMQPVAAGGGAVVAQNRKPRHLLAGLEFLAVDGHVAGIAAVQQLGHVGRRKLAVFLPGFQAELLHRIGEHPAVFGVQGPHPLTKSQEHFAVGLGGAARGRRLTAPLQPAAGVGDGTFFFHVCGTGQQEDFCIHGFGLDAGAVPERGRFVVEQVDADHPLELGKGFAVFTRVGSAAGRVLAPSEKALQLAGGHFVEDGQPEVVGHLFACIHLGHETVAFSRLHIRVHGLQEAGDVFRPVLPPVDAHGVVGLGRKGLVVGRQIRKAAVGHGQVARPAFGEHALVRGPLHVGFAAQGVDPAPGNAHVAQQKLHNGHGPDVLHPNRMLGPAQGVHDGPGFIRLTGGGKGLVDPLDVRLCAPHGFGRRFQGIAGIMAFQQVQHATGVFEGLVALGHAVFVHVKGPEASVVALGFSVIAGEYAVLEVVFGAYDHGRTGVVLQVFRKIQLVVQNVFDQAADEGDVRARTKGHVEMALGRSAGKTGVHMDKRSPAQHGLQHPFEGNGVVLGRVGTHNQHTVTIGDVLPMVAHRAASERLCQSRYSCAVSEPRLVLYVHQAERSHKCLNGPGFFVVHGGRAERSNAESPVDGLALVVFLGKGGVAGAFDVGRNAVEHPVPLHFFPFFGFGGAVHGLGGPGFVFGDLPKAGALGTQGAFVDGVIRVAFKVQHPVRAVARGLVARVDQCAAAHGTVTTDGRRLFGPFQTGDIGPRGNSRKGKGQAGKRGGQRGPGSRLEQCSSCKCHKSSVDCQATVCATAIVKRLSIMHLNYVVLCIYQEKSHKNRSAIQIIMPAIISFSA